ncbi:MAG: glycosyltransferase family 2 protein [Pseudomonadota bacterium]
MTVSPASPTPAPELAIIVISYNTREMTVECLQSVYAETETPFELVVVDNASTDGSAEAIRAAFPPAAYPNLTLIAEDKNHGFAPAHDIAIPRSSAPWVLLLNPDTLVKDRALDNLLAFAKRTPEAGIWGGRTTNGDGTLNPYSCWRKQSLWSTFCRVSGLTGVFPKSEIFNPEQYGGWDRSTERDVDIVTGCLFMMRRQDWLRLGGFDPAFVMYGEEADLCQRAAAQGMRPRISPEATIVHYGRASENVESDRMVRVLRAKSELIHRHFHPATRAAGIALLQAWPLTRRVATAVLARLRSSEEQARRSKTWADIWRRRAEWRNGFGSESRPARTTMRGAES